MDFIKYTINWCKGEIFEGRLIFLIGIICLITTFSLWKCGTSPAAKTLIMPVLILSLLFIGTGLSRNFSIQKKMVSFEKTYKEDPLKFVVMEKKRTEGFIKWYAYSRYACAALIVIGLIVFLLTLAPLWKSISLCLIILAFAVLVVDYFSEERANQYYGQIIKYYHQ